MSGFDLDLGSIEAEMDDPGNSRVILGVLDGSTPGEDWARLVANGHVLVLDVDGDLEALASRFAPPVKADGGSLVHFRGFLIVTPEGLDIDTDRLGA